MAAADYVNRADCALSLPYERVEKVMTNTTRTALGIWFVLVVSAACLQPASSEANSKEQRIQELLELTSAGDLGVQVMHEVLEPLKQALPAVPAEW